MSKLFKLSLVLCALNFSLAHAGDSLADALGGEENAVDNTEENLGTEIKLTSNQKLHFLFVLAFKLLEKTRTAHELAEAHSFIAKIGYGQEALFLQSLTSFVKQIYQSRWSEAQMEQLLWSLPRIIVKIPKNNRMNADMFLPVFDLLQEILWEKSPLLSSSVRIRAAQTWAEMSLVVPAHADLEKKTKSSLARVQRLAQISEARFTEEYVDSQNRAKKVLEAHFIREWMSIASPEILLEKINEGKMPLVLLAMMADMNLEVEDVRESVLFYRDPRLVQTLQERLPYARAQKQKEAPGLNFFTGYKLVTEDGLWPNWSESSTFLSEELTYLSRSSIGRWSLLKGLHR